MDWSADNIVAVALGSCVYLWNAQTGNIEQLTEFEEGDYAGSLSWIQEGQILGCPWGDLEILSIRLQKSLADDQNLRRSHILLLVLRCFYVVIKRQLPIKSPMYLSMYTAF